MRKGLFHGLISKTVAVFAAVVMLACTTGMVLAGHPNARGTEAADKPDRVGEREYKFLIQPGERISSAEERFREVWRRVKSSAAKNGYAIIERRNYPLTLERSAKEYFDTRDQALWRAGYVLRVTTPHEGRKPDAMVNVTIKAIHEDASRTLNTPLTVVGAQKVRVGAEENIGFVPGGKLGSYIEKGVSFNTALESLGKFTLGDFGRFMPELLDLGLPPQTALVGTKVFSYSVKPGAIVLPGVKPCEVTMEAWSTTENGVPEIYDFSFGYKMGDSQVASQTQAAAEQFMIRVLEDGLSEWHAPAEGKWGGSKVRRLMNRPVAAR